MLRRTLIVGAVSLLTTIVSRGLEAQTIGIPACDDFLKKYETCVTSKIPSAQRGMFESQFEQMRKAWSEAAKNAAAKATLESTCKQSAEQTKVMMANFGCAF
jgi:hypothetical protein